MITEELKKHVVEYMDQVYPDKNITFKVDARRGDKQYPVSSEQINRDMGEAILEAFPQMKVDVHHPDVLLSSQPPDNKERCCRSSRNIEEIIMFICQQSTANACGST